ncbi:TPA: glycosyltransferase family 4 protein [Kluyvera ascorbata]|nr:glycosyltransferase family 4 protein [Kluyvera ascorbata]
MKNTITRFLKKAFVKFRYTRLARKLWKLFALMVNAHYPRRLLIKALNVNAEQNANEFTVFPKILKSSSDKNALVIMPFYGNDAVGKNIDTKISTLKSLGFTIHAIVFNNSPWDSNSVDWDYTYNIKCRNGKFGTLRHDVNQQIIPDGNKIDDWLDDEICQFVAALSAMNNYQIAIVNYVFLSKLCLYLKPNTVSVIDTHDVFAKRNTRMAKIGISQDKFYFSTSKKEETIGLSRANYIFAIQEAEGRYFRENVSSQVIVQPPILDVNFIDYVPTSNKKIVVGFMASGHYPNVVAINNFIDSLSKLDHNVRLDISGTICGALEGRQYPGFVNILGFCESLDKFYHSCDVIINPDELLSGLKVKCLEALSYGVPLVSTKAAMEGIESTEEYHQIESAQKCAEFITSLKKDELINMATQSRNVFANFNQRYNFQSTLRKVLKDNG